jgi:hypothetical protein
MNFDWGDIKGHRAAEESFPVKSISGYLDDYLEHIRPENNKLSLLFSEFDDDMKGKLRGKLGLVIGYSGSKKSIYTQLVGVNNILNGNRVLFSTMEMSAPSYIERMMNMVIEPNNNGWQPAYMVEFLEREHPGYARNSFLKMANALDDKVFISENSGMTPADYDRVLSYLSQQGSEIDILVVDGLGMMGGNGTEVELNDKNTRHLKELAKKYNILVMLICHCARGGKRTDRDLSKFIRGGEKAVDNCDFYLSMWQIEKEPDVFVEDFGGVTYFNKRGSGMRFERFYQFNRVDLSMKETVRTEDEIKSFRKEIEMAF